jgi:hypothetical protein
VTVVTLSALYAIRLADPELKPQSMRVTSREQCVDPTTRNSSELRSCLTYDSILRSLL